MPMADERTRYEDEPTQETEQGYEIPVPKRSTFDTLLRRVAPAGGSNGHDAKGNKSG